MLRRPHIAGGTALGIAIALLASTAAWARQNGLATSGCTGCHGGGTEPNTTVSVSDAHPAPGGSTTVTVIIDAVNGGPGGMYLRANAGSFTVITGQGTRLVSPKEVVHSSPRAASGGKVTFQVSWTAPNTPGGVDFDAWVLSANGNGASSGDGAGYGHTSIAFGCAGTTYYRDQDLDGVGTAVSGTTVNCAPPAGFSALDGDCNDNDETIFPGQTEVCDGKDNDCDGAVDENLAPITLYPDADHDGHGVPSSQTKTGCTPPPGWAPTHDDCADDDPARHPGAAEVCNFEDDNCDGEVDEGARVICGVGMCARYGLSCDPKLCTPGQPEPEQCNYLDDDCDGVNDNDAVCPPGEYCDEGVCVEGEPPDAGHAGSGGRKPGSCATGPGCSAVPGASLVALVFGLGSAAIFARRRRTARLR
ncbi:MAG: putative metal-binding motif-containing protein [Myxococcaceae bacterium]|nr:putative metal-binding motif-containing protein [Myxococcaceae bacterium]